MHSLQLLLPGQSQQNVFHEHAQTGPCWAGTMSGCHSAPKTGCCKQWVKSTTHTCCYLLTGLLVSPRAAFKFLLKTFLVHTQTSCPTAWCVRQQTRGLSAGVLRFPSSSSGGTEAIHLMGPRVKTLHLDIQALIHTVTLLRAWLPPSLLAADTCQLSRKWQCTSLVPAFRCCSSSYHQADMFLICPD